MEDKMIPCPGAGGNITPETCARRNMAACNGCPQVACDEWNAAHPIGTPVHASVNPNGFTTQRRMCCEAHTPPLCGEV